MKSGDLAIMRFEIAQAVEASVPPVVKATVNGKIDRLTNELNEHRIAHADDIQALRDDNEALRQSVEALRPILEGMAGAKVLGVAIRWLAGVVAAAIVIKEFLIR